LFFSLEIQHDSKVHVQEDAAKLRIEVKIQRNLILQTGFQRINDRFKEARSKVVYHHETCSEFYTMQEHILQTRFKRMEILVAQTRTKPIKKEDEVAAASSAYMNE
jgi:hypothetical protein